MPPKKGKADPRKQYFEAIKSQKLDTLRWCLRHGGVSVKAEDDDGHTGVQIAAAGGFTDALESLIENVRKVGEPADLEEPDEDGRTPLMMACYNGKLDCVKALVLQGKVKLDTKCEAGKTAMMYAESRKQEKIVAFLANPNAPPPEEEEEEEDEDEEARKRVFKASQRSAGQATAAAAQEEVHRQRVEAAEALEKSLASSAPPVWPEVEPILKETRRELSIRGKPALQAASGPVDPAVWNCVCLFELRLELAERALTRLPKQLARLVDLVTLIVSANGLVELPDELGTLSKLRNLEAAGNELRALPASLAQLKGLQVVDVSKNHLTSLAPLAGLTELVAVNVGYNELTELPLAWESLEHTQSLAAPHNQIGVMPPGLGQLQMLVTLDLAENQITQARAHTPPATRPCPPPPAPAVRAGWPARLLACRDAAASRGATPRDR
jgi:hypothetical protein